MTSTSKEQSERIATLRTGELTAALFRLATEYKDEQVKSLLSASRQVYVYLAQYVSLENADPDGFNDDLDLTDEYLASGVFLELPNHPEHGLLLGYKYSKHERNLPFGPYGANDKKAVFVPKGLRLWLIPSKWKTDGLAMQSWTNQDGTPGSIAGITLTTREAGSEKALDATEIHSKRLRESLATYPIHRLYRNVQMTFKASLGVVGTVLSLPSFAALAGFIVSLAAQPELTPQGNTETLAQRVWTELTTIFLFLFRPKNDLEVIAHESLQLFNSETSKEPVYSAMRILKAMDEPLKAVSPLSIQECLRISSLADLCNATDEDVRINAKTALRAPLGQWLKLKIPHEPGNLNLNTSFSVLELDMPLAHVIVQRDSIVEDKLNNGLEKSQSFKVPFNRAFEPTATFTNAKDATHHTSLINELSSTESNTCSPLLLFCPSAHSLLQFAKQ